MLRTIGAIIEPAVRVRFLEEFTIAGARRALVTLLDAPSDETDADLPLSLSEPALARDWDRPEEDAAWAHLQPEV